MGLAIGRPLTLSTGYCSTKRCEGVRTGHDIRMTPFLPVPDDARGMKACLVDSLIAVRRPVAPVLSSSANCR